MKTLTVMVASMMLFAGVSLFACGGDGCEKGSNGKGRCEKQGGKGEKGGKHKSGMFKALELSEEQAVQVKTIHEEYHAKMKDASEEKKSQLKSEMVEMINDVLTEEQRTKFAELRNKCEKKEGKGCGKGGKGGKGKGCEGCNK